jgi:enoyl-CoA hydratase/carnithine racemase
VDVRYIAEDGLGIAELQAVERRNALRPESADDIFAALVQADQGSSIGAFTVCTEGPSFCSATGLKVSRKAGGDPAPTWSLDSFSRIYTTFNRQVGTAVAIAAAGSRR